MKKCLLIIENCFRNMFRVVHLVPYDGIGGVEMAVRSMGNLQEGNIDFKVDYIYKDLLQDEGITATYNPWLLFCSAWRISCQNPDLLLLSLWRSSFVGVLVKLLRPRIRLVTFIHSERDVHFLDYFCTRLSLSLSVGILADSVATVKGRLSLSQCSRSQVISFVTRRFSALPPGKVAPSFIFWGRVSQQKGLDRAVRIFAAVHELYPDARFLVIGPDGGALPAIQKQCELLGLADAVTFAGAASHEQIVDHAAQASFYLQTSLIEGMAMSVVEAMQLGLVPVVTPVGEIASYCEDGRNAVMVESDGKAVADILSLLRSHERYQALRRAAIHTWNEKPLYRDSVLAACQKIIEGDLSLQKRIR